MGIISLSIMFSFGACTVQVPETAILQQTRYRYGKAFAALGDSSKAGKLFQSALRDSARQMLPAALADVSVRRDYFVANDSTKLEYFTFRSTLPDRPAKQTIFYFLGNLETVASIHHQLAQMALQADPVVHCLHYRGYGFSNGKLSLTTQFADNQKFVAQLRNEAVPMTAIGYSLGSGYASRAAAEAGMDRLILLSPYSSASDVLLFYKKQSTPGLKAVVRPFLRMKADSVLLNISNTQMAANFPGQVTVFHAEDDATLPLYMSKRVAGASMPGKSSIYIWPTGGHSAAFESAHWQQIVSAAKR